ncbi:hypothetical protein [Micrococcus sp.]|uniref:hypothetical protein n=1 Tax=Micrococcus sp. TaxID=1271 RepID=UPI002A919BE7|nr:hypothetical protein [Micrococcus sp.]MDY6055547.1 hypothetical protein [Micrococcus sp.]
MVSRHIPAAPGAGRTAPRRALALLACAGLVLGVSGCRAQDEVDSLRTSTRTDASATSSGIPHSTSPGEPERVDPTPVSPTSSEEAAEEPTVAYTITRVAHGGEELEIPADPTVLIPEGKRSFRLLVPTCPSFLFDIEVVSETTWVGTKSAYQRAEACTASTPQTERFSALAQDLFVGEIEVADQGSRLVLSADGAEMTLDHQPQ